MRALDYYSLAVYGLVLRVSAVQVPAFRSSDFLARLRHGSPETLVSAARVVVGQLPVSALEPDGTPEAKRLDNVVVFGRHVATRAKDLTASFLRGLNGCNLLAGSDFLFPSRQHVLLMMDLLGIPQPLHLSVVKRGGRLIVLLFKRLDERAVLAGFCSKLSERLSHDVFGPSG